MITQEQVLLLTDKARQIARLWPDTRQDDLRQELVVRWMQHWEAIRGYVEDEDGERGSKKLDKTLTRWSHEWCRKETAAVRGSDDFARYSSSNLKLMLPLLHSPEAWGSLAVVGAGGKSSKPAREGGDSLATYADLTRAFDLLDAEDKALIVFRYVDEEPNWQSMAAEFCGCSEDAARMRTSRALARMERLLAGRPKSEGATHVGRRVMTNAAAQSKTNREW